MIAADKNWWHSPYNIASPTLAKFTVCRFFFISFSRYLCCKAKAESCVKEAESSNTAGQKSLDSKLWIV